LQWPPMNRSSVLHLILVATFAGCTYVNQPLNPADTPVTAWQTNHTHAAIRRGSDRSPAVSQPFAGDGWFVGLAISGGGLRSANFSGAVMPGLQRLGRLGRVGAGPSGAARS